MSEFIFLYRCEGRSASSEVMLGRQEAARSHFQAALSHARSPMERSYITKRIERM